MRFGLLTALALAVLAPGVVNATGPEKTMLELRSGLINPGLPLAESDFGAYGVRLTAQVDKQGGGSGTLELDPNAPAAPTFDEFGFRTYAAALPPVKLECTLKFVKKRKVTVPLENRIGGPEKEEEWLLFEIAGPKLTSRLSLAILADGSSGRLLVHGKDGKVKYVLDVTTPPPPPPCHPGCFPAGTAIRVPDGTKPVERIREGDLVTTVGLDGAAVPRKVVSVFVTKNRLMEVRTDTGNLVTTETQPIALVDGGFRAAGELKAGDRVFRWDGEKRLAVTVKSTLLTGREEPVFNLVLGDPAIFIAGDFLVRSKPPALASAVKAKGLQPDRSLAKE
jgi:hypothetical protein